MLTAFLVAALQAQPLPPIVVTPVPPLVIAPPLPPVPPPVPGARPAMPRGPIVRLFTSDDYPAAAMDSDQQGLVDAEMNVGVDGRVTACRIVGSSDSASLDRATCSIIQRRARFSPARDAAGSPVPGYWRQRVRWEMEALPFEPFERITRVATGPHGILETCAGSDDCHDSGFTLDSGWLTLTGNKIPATSALVIERRFDLARHSAGKYPGTEILEYETLFAGRVRVGVNHNGKVTSCMALGGGVGHADRLCSLASQWLFKLGPTKGETRTGVVTMTLRAAPLATGLPKQARNKRASPRFQPTL